MEFKRTVREDPVTGGILRSFEHPCGMAIHIIPKSGFSKQFAGIAIPFGSVHNEFRGGNGGKIVLPAGSAHYMEHCVFYRDGDGGLLSALSALGASANAYTSNTHTLYYFSCAGQFEEILGKYLEAVLHPYLGEDRIEAERSIILQELSMYRDDPDSRIYNELLQSLYVSHPVRDDIGGVPESVAGITAAHLQAAAGRFYTPSSVILTAAGNVDESAILEIASRAAEKAACVGRPSEDDYFFPDEPDHAGTARTDTAMDVTVGSFLLGFKNSSVSPARSLAGPQQIRLRRSGQLFWEMLLGRSSPIYETLFAEGLINDSFGYHFVCEGTYSFLAAGGESPDPEKACGKLRAMIREAFARMPDEASSRRFEVQKRSAGGSFIRSLDSVEHCGLTEVSASLSGINLFDFPDLYDKMSLEETADSMRFVLDDAAASEAYVGKKGS